LKSRTHLPESFRKIVIYELGKIRNMTTTNKFVIETRELTKSYGDFFALKPLNLKVPQKTIFAFLGPNGAGKTTTIRILLGLSRSSSGTATIFDQDVSKAGTEIRKKIGYLAQNPQFYRRMTARETMQFAGRFFYSGSKNELESQIDELLGIVGLADNANRPIRGFSGGERQRLGIGQALINSPDLLILDEPAAGLDPKGREDVLHLMEKLRKNKTIFYSTHILDDVQRVSDLAAILNHGTLVAQDSIENLLSGKNGIVFQVELKGDLNDAYQKITAQDWVTGVQAKTQNDKINWYITVSNETKAEDELLPLLIQNKVKVVQYGRQRFELEDVFMSLVEDKKNGRN
jgi:ABC-2 type transport system ATP-binding protein